MSLSFQKISKFGPKILNRTYFFGRLQAKFFLYLEWIKGYLNGIPCKYGCCQLNYVEAHQLLSLKLWMIFGPILAVLTNTMTIMAKRLEIRIRVIIVI